MDLQERFRYIMKLNNLTASAFADEIGVQRSSISHILSGRNKPSLEFIQKILDRYPKIDAAWLINGTTKVEKKDEVDPQPSADKAAQVVSDSNLQNEPVDSPTEMEVAANVKTIKRILIFYSDNSFEEFIPPVASTNQ